MLVAYCFGIAFVFFSAFQPTLPSAHFAGCARCVLFWYYIRCPCSFFCISAYFVVSHFAVCARSVLFWYCIHCPCSLFWISDYFSVSLLYRSVEVWSLFGLGWTTFFRGSPHAAAAVTDKWLLVTSAKFEIILCEWTKNGSMRNTNKKTREKVNHDLTVGPITDRGIIKNGLETFNMIHILNPNYKITWIT